uniref:sensor histidine kinase n=1 Tax=Lachnoclostridium phocaeense TaxID=1871021 RepID=UPI0026DAEF28|nr:HAMP domain-containing sensor histidine kinase [Lachnoclostridium phocaeense]
MIRRLRIKFTAAAVGAMAIVLTVILGIVNGVNYHNVIRDAGYVLDLLAEHQGDFPDDGVRGSRQRRPGISPETPYETRFFTVTVGKNGDILATDTERIAAVDAADAEVYAGKALDTGRKEGFLDDYRYRCESVGGDDILIIFLDCTRSLTTFRNFFFTSILVSVMGVAAVSLLILLASGRIVRPFVENYEKQKRFITDAGHELKTPLTIIDADAAVMEMELGENEWLQDIKRQTRYLRELTEDLIYLSRTEERGEHFVRADFSISEVAEEVTDSFGALAIAQEKKFRSRIEPMVSYCGGAGEIRRLFAILLDNAVKYSAPEGEISFSLGKEGKAVRIRVSNTVEHIDREQLARLFDRFYRTDSSRNSETGGHGLGLSIARAVVTAHRGKIWASTETGRDLTVTVLLFRSV